MPPAAKRHITNLRGPCGWHACRFRVMGKQSRGGDSNGRGDMKTLSTGARSVGDVGQDGCVARGAGMPGDGGGEGLLGLADAIEGLRAELTAAVDKGAGQRSRLRFAVTEPVVLEVSVVTTRDAQGKVGWKVVEVGGSYTAENTHRITVTLDPQWWNGDKQEYTTDFLIAADVPPGATFGPRP